MVSHSNNIQYVKIRISLPTDYIYIYLGTRHHRVFVYLTMLTMSRVQNSERANPTVKYH